MRTPQFAVIGCGRMGRERARHIERFGGALAALADVDRDRADMLACEYPGVAVYASIRDLPWRTLDGVFVCTPPALHAQAIELAVENGAAVFVEKPLAIDAPQAEQLARLVEREGIVNSVGYMNRARASVAVARDSIAAVQPIAFCAHWAGTRYRVPWWSDAQLSGGAFHEQATHLVDLLRFLGGDIETAFALEGATPERTCAALRFRSGAVGTLVHTCEAREKEIAVTAITADGVIRLSGWEFLITENTVDGRGAEPNDPFAEEVEAFVRAVATGTRHAAICDFADAWRTQIVVDCIRQSALHARGGAFV